ncbi:hypothetical protein AYI69_g2609 [Smittium culicis]|uniref:Uncharacterized protein n=1 Tax=Smittium culicis TaxID=133412 RepID=A0A1R1YM33_9FUNG|nr:hypothetical protein AYI69_g2609 [Smittium culicis]
MPDRFKSKEGSNNNKRTWRDLYKDSKDKETKHHEQVLKKVRDASEQLKQQKFANKVKFQSKIPNLPSSRHINHELVYSNRRFAKANLTPLQKARKETKKITSQFSGTIGPAPFIIAHTGPVHGISSYQSRKIADKQAALNMKQMPEFKPEISLQNKVANIISLKAGSKTIDKNCNSAVSSSSSNSNFGFNGAGTGIPFSRSVCVKPRNDDLGRVHIGNIINCNNSSTKIKNNDCSSVSSVGNHLSQTDSTINSEKRIPFRDSPPKIINKGHTKNNLCEQSQTNNANMSFISTQRSKTSMATTPKPELVTSTPSRYSRGNADAKPMGILNKPKIISNNAQSYLAPESKNRKSKLFEKVAKLNKYHNNLLNSSVLNNTKHHQS